MSCINIYEHVLTVDNGRAQKSLFMTLFISTAASQSLISTVAFNRLLIIYLSCTMLVEHV